MPRWIGKAGVAVLTIAATGWGGWQFLPAGSPPSPAPNVMMLQPAAVPRLAAVSVVPSFPGLQRVKVLPAVATGTLASEALKRAPTPVPTSTATSPTRSVVQEPGLPRSTGSSELVTAKATTWVNVRAEANARSAIVGMILPDSIVELGESRRGWRRVSTRWFSGWASAKLFTVDSLGQ